MQKNSIGSRLFDIINIFIMILVIIITLYPFLHVASVSISNIAAVSSGQVTFYPVGIDLDAYKFVLKDPRIATGYKNTILYMAVGTLMQMVVTSISAYALSKKGFTWRNILLMAVTFTMMFNGGMIPNYAIVRSLRMIDTMWAMIIPRLINTWYLLIMKTFFESLPESLSESAYLDGASEFKTFTYIIMPLSVPIFLTITLFYAVGHWNTYFNALLYLNSADKYPLQLVLRNIIIAGQTAMENMSELEEYSKIALMARNIRAATIMVATIPIICIYPFIQKYFTQGVMIGAIKG